MHGTAGIRAFPTAFLWPRWAKMARNGAAESGRCSSGQWGADDGGIGRVPAVSFGEGCGWRAPCEGAPTAARRSKSSRIRCPQRAKNARNWQVRAGRSSPSSWKCFLSQKGESWRLHRSGCRRPRGRRLPLRAMCNRWAVNPLIRFSAGNPLEGQMFHILIF